MDHYLEALIVFACLVLFLDTLFVVGFIRSIKSSRIKDTFLSWIGTKKPVILSIIFSSIAYLSTLICFILGLIYKAYEPLGLAIIVLMLDFTFFAVPISIMAEIRKARKNKAIQTDEEPKKTNEQSKE